MNLYTVYAAEHAIPASPKDAKKLKKSLAANDRHGFELDVSKEGRKTLVYLSAPEQGDTDKLPKGFLKLLGGVIGKAGLKHLGIGYACTADRGAAGSQGGGSFRVYPDGETEYPVLTYFRKGG